MPTSLPPRPLRSKAEKPDDVDDIDYWLRMLSAPRPSVGGTDADNGPKHLPPPLEPPPAKRAGKSERSTRQSEVDSIDYWLREMRRKRPTGD